MTLLETSTAEGALKGMILARAPHELNDQEVAYLQDAIINQPGFVNRRGAITGTTAITAANLDSQRPAAVCTVYDPSGVQKIGVVYLKDTGTQYDVWLAVFDTSLAFIQKHYLSTSIVGTFSYPFRYVNVQCAPAIDGSIIISLRSTYGRGIVNAIAARARVLRWYGGCPSTSIAAGAAPTATVAATEGSTSVTGGAAEIAKISFPGTIIEATGVVASATSTTQVELMYPSPKTYAATATNFFIGETLPIARARGKISCAAAVLTGITGYGTKFTESRDRATITPSTGFDFIDPTTMRLLASLNANAPAPAASDTVSGVPTSVTRSAALKNYLMYASFNVPDRYFNRFVQPIAGVAGFTPKAVKGSWWTTYKGYMVSFNGLVEDSISNNAGDIATTGRGYIHGPRFPDIMDHSVADGDWFEVQSTKGGDPDGVACQGGNNAVILCKGQETFALSGSNPDDFQLDKIADDGALSFESVTSWKGAPIWMGRTGIWMFTGEGMPENIVENTLGPRWKELVAAFDANLPNQDGTNYPTMQARCFVYKDYLFVNVAWTGGVHRVYTDGVARSSNTMQLMIYMPTRAVSYLTNFNFQAFIQLGLQGYVILPQSASTTHHFFPVDNLFTQGLATVDSILTVNSYDSGVVSTSVGPWFHMESRKFSAGDGLWRKTWKQLSIESLMTSTKRMFLETVAGLNTTGVRQPTPYVGTGLFVAIKNKFNARDQYMSFRLYEDINNRPATLKLGAWQWAFKFARRGQV